MCSGTAQTKTIIWYREHLAHIPCHSLTSFLLKVHLHAPLFTGLFVSPPSAEARAEQLGQGERQQRCADDRQKLGHVLTSSSSEDTTEEPER